MSRAGHVGRWMMGTAMAVGLAGCTPVPSEARRYELQGQILALRADANEVLIKHGDIQNFMPGMTMPFKVRDGRLLSGKVAGDVVTAQLVVGDNEAWLETLEKTGSAPLDTEAAIPRHPL